MGFEESYGYLAGTHARDKDAVVASMLFAEMVCYYNSINVSVYQRLNELYDKYGYVFDTNESIVFSGLNAMRDMIAVVDKIKKQKIDNLGGIKVVAMRDYSAGIKTLADGKTEELGVPKNNAVYFELEGGGFVCARPSGTEPKLKLYYSVKGENKAVATEIYEKIKADFNKLVSGEEKPAPKKAAAKKTETAAKKSVKKATEKKTEKPVKAEKKAPVEGDTTKKTAVKKSTKKADK